MNPERGIETKNPSLLARIELLSNHILPSKLRDLDVKNIGLLIINNGNKVVLETVTPFNPKKIFITAEDSGNLNYPRGREISRTTFSQ